MKIPQNKNTINHNHISYERKLSLVKRMQNLSAYIENKYGKNKASGSPQLYGNIERFAQKIA